MKPKPAKDKIPNKARDRINRLELALRVIYTWAGVPGALEPESVRRLAGKALEDGQPTNGS